MLIKTVVQLIQHELPNNYRVILFGSWAKGNALPASDMDFGIIGEQALPWEKYLSIKRQLDSIPTLRSIDLVDMNRVDEHFKKNALAYAQYL